MIDWISPDQLFSLLHINSNRLATCILVCGFNQKKIIEFKVLNQNTISENSRRSFQEPLTCRTRPIGRLWAHY